MIIGGLDLETTGLDADDGHKIIEICLATYDLGTQECLDVYTKRINPLRGVPAESTAVHGITGSMLVGAPTFEEVYKTEIAPILNKIELAVIHNAAFDSVFMATEILNLGEPLPEFETFCTMENGRWATFSGKNPNLGELCYALDVDYDPKEAHAADYDVFKMMDCFFAGRSLNRFKLEGEE